MSTVEGRVALVTGASSGIGAATARALAAGGREAGAGLAPRPTTWASTGALARPCDVRDPQQIEALVAETVERFGGLDIVVANAGVGAYGDFLDLDPAHLEEMIDVNVKGLLYTVRAGLPHLLESDAADLVVVASVAGQRAPEGEAVYAASEVRAGRLHALARPRAVPARRALLDDRARRGAHRVRDGRGPRAHARGPRPARHDAGRRRSPTPSCTPSRGRARTACSRRRSCP